MKSPSTGRLWAAKFLQVRSVDALAVGKWSSDVLADLSRSILWRQSFRLIREERRRRAAMASQRGAI